MTSPQPLALANPFGLCSFQECCYQKNINDTHDGTTGYVSVCDNTFVTQETELAKMEQPDILEKNDVSLSVINERFSPVNDEACQSDATVYDTGMEVPATDFTTVVENRCPRELYPVFPECDEDPPTGNHEGSKHVSTTMERQVGHLVESQVASQVNQGSLFPEEQDSEQIKFQELEPSPTAKHGFWLPNAQAIARERDHLEDLLQKVECLIRDEFILSSHTTYLELVDRLDRLLDSNKLRILGLIRPAGYLSRVYARALDASTIKMRRKTSSVAMTVAGDGGPVVQRAECVTVFGRSTSTFSFGASTMVAGAVDPALFFSRHTSGWFAEIPQPSFQSTDHPEPKQKRNSDYHYAPLGLGTLAEPISLCPLKSQRHSNNASDMDVPSDATEKGLTLRNLIGTGGNKIDNAQQQRRLGRVPLQRRVWFLGELPAIVFATEDVCAEHGASLNIVRQQNVSQTSEPLDGAGDEPVNCSYTYTRRTVGGLSLPVDIQIMCMFSPPTEVTTCGNESTTATGTTSIIVNPIAAPSNVPDKVSNLQEKPSSLGKSPSQPINTSTADHQHTTNRSSLFGETDTVSSYGLMTWLHFFLERLVNNPQIHKLRMQFYQTERALAVLAASANPADKSWNSIVTKEYRALWNVQDEGNAICVIEGTMKSPIFQCLSLINESDLHKNWLPFLSESRKVHQVSQFTQVLCQRTNFPWPLDDRESLMLGYAIDGLHLPTPSIIMNGESVPDDAVSVFGLPLTPPCPGLTRMRVNFFTFELRPNVEDAQVTMAKLVVFLDPQMTFIPKAVQSFIARQSATRLFTNMQRLCARFEKSIYAQRVKENPDIYGVVEERLRNFYETEHKRVKPQISI